MQLSNNRNDQAVPLIYSQYDQQLSLDNVKRVTIQGGRQITGEFKQKVLMSGKDVTKFTVKLPVENSDDELNRLRAHNVEIEAKEPGQTFTTVIAFLPYLFLIGLWVFLFRQMQAGGAKAFSFGKSKAKLLTGDTPKVTFADVAGADEAKVEPAGDHRASSRIPQKFTKLGGRLAEGRAAGRAARHPCDATGEGRRQVKLVARSSRWAGIRTSSRCLLAAAASARMGSVRAGQGSRAVHHLHRRDRRVVGRHRGWPGRRMMTNASKR